MHLLLLLHLLHLLYLFLPPRPPHPLTLLGLLAPCSCSCSSFPATHARPTCTCSCSCTCCTCSHLLLPPRPPPPPHLARPYLHPALAPAPFAHSSPTTWSCSPPWCQMPRKSDGQNGSTTSPMMEHPKPQHPAVHLRGGGGHICANF